MQDNHGSHIKAVLQALLVTFLWSTSFIIIKVGLDEIPPLLYAGLRYFLAFLILLPFAVLKGSRLQLSNISRGDYAWLIILGLLFYTITQGTQFIGLSLLPAVTVSLILNFSPLVVALIAFITIKEVPSLRQWLGTIIFLAGIVTYFVPIDFTTGEITGFIVMFIGVIANSSSSVLGRKLNMSGNLSPILITVISMGIGSFILLLAGLIRYGIPEISLVNILFLIWLSAVNTAFAFTLWNKTLKTLSAMESSIINGTMLIQIAILAWIFLGEEISLRETAGMLTAAIGVLLVQLKKVSLFKRDLNKGSV